MKTPDLEAKRTFLVASSDSTRLPLLGEMVERHILKSTVALAQDGQEALFKASNVFPQVVIIDGHLNKVTNFELAQKLLDLAKENPISIILLTAAPDQETFVDEVVTGHVQFLPSIHNEQVFAQALAKALNALSLEDNSSYRLKFLSSGDFLFREKDIADNIFIVKRGELEAIRDGGGEAVVLGKIKPGEFVGEMAHFNAETRSASVRALCDSELIEIPKSSVDMVLFSKPAWAKALVATLSRRLKNSNIRLSN